MAGMRRWHRDQRTPRGEQLYKQIQVFRQELRTLADAIRRSGQLQIGACYTRSPEKRAAFAAKYGCRPAESYEAILADPEIEAIVISHGHPDHYGGLLSLLHALEHPISVFVHPAAFYPPPGDRPAATAWWS